MFHLKYPNLYIIILHHQLPLVITLSLHYLSALTTHTNYSINHIHTNQLTIPYHFITYTHRTLKETLLDLKVDWKAMGGKEITHSAMHYRKVCNHPFLFGDPKNDDG